MSEKFAPISSTNEPGPAEAAPITATEVDYVVGFEDVDNPHQLQALMHQKVMRVYKVLVMNGEIVQFISLESSSLVDERYLVN